jgi:hypothetical protein
MAKAKFKITNHPLGRSPLFWLAVTTALVFFAFFYWALKTVLFT